MPEMLIPCPKCGSTLKLRDRSLLGRKGKCPKCGHGFILEEPDEVQLELAEPAPVVGKAAQWVPDDAPVQPVATAATAVVPDFGAPDPLAVPAPARSVAARRRKSGGQQLGIIVGGVLALLVAGGVAAGVYFSQDRQEGPSQAKRQSGKSRPAAGEGSTAPEEAPPVSLAELSPTSGQPLTLMNVPSGATILFHLHPAQLWEDSEQFEEIRYGLGPVALWAEAKIKELCLYEPKEIEELLVSVSVLSQGMDLEVAAIVRLKQPMQPADLRSKMGTPRAVGVKPIVYVTETLAGMQIDERTFSTITPAGTPQVEELTSSYEGSGVPSDAAIEAILARTDADRHFTVVFPPEQTRIYLASLVPQEARPFFNQLCFWLGDDIEAAAWSAHVTKDQFFSQWILRSEAVSGNLVVRPERLVKEMERKVEALPGELYGAVLKMEPKQVGPRKLIGRLPAMVEAYSMGTLGDADDRYVELTTVLPERAGPNLAAAALLAWDESTRTDFTKTVSAAPTQSGTKLPETVAGRLELKLEIDFRKTPLEEAFRYIFDELKVAHSIDGDGLKSAGFTKNMPQDHQLGNVSAATAIKTILAKYEKERDPIVVVIDEANKSALVTVKSVAAQKGLTPYEFK